MAAERAAHLTSTSTADGLDRPSIFEVLAQENLMTTLRPAIKHVARVAAEKNPSRYGLFLAYNDEIFTLLDFVLQRNYLTKYGASFGENFYGMKRVMVDGTEKLTPQAKRKSIVFLVLFPYLKLKCDTWYETWKEHHQTSQGHSQLRVRLVKAYLAVYPVVHALWESVLLYHQLAYIFNKERVHTPLLRFAGVLLKQLSPDDIDRQTALDARVRPFQTTSVLGTVHSLLSAGLGSVAWALSSSLSVGMFFVQFLEWWYSSDERAASLTALPVPEPPQKYVSDCVPKSSTVCPVCLRFRTNDTALAVSGFVFCYPCIYKYVAEHRCCPVTNYPANSDHLVKLYRPDS